MEKSYDVIFDYLLEEYEKNPNVELNVLAQSVAEKLSMEINLDEIDETNKFVDSIQSAYNDLKHEKEEKGISTESWVKNRLISKAADSGLDEEDQVKAIEIVTQSINMNNNVNLEQID